MSTSGSTHVLPAFWLSGWRSQSEICAGCIVSWTTASNRRCFLV
ncbi:MAG TPA: hypothetical protein VKB35_20700 [Ktedonobacteraceae bacterium]|nr:hypothetical protein [Ktedonobacteraceae bacterium]